MRTMYILKTDDRRPTSHFGKFQTAISRHRVIRSTSRLVLGIGFSRLADRMDLRPVGPNPVNSGHISIELLSEVVKVISNEH